MLSYKIHFKQHEFGGSGFSSILLLFCKDACSTMKTRRSVTSTTLRGWGVYMYMYKYVQYVFVYISMNVMCVSMAYACKSFPQIIYDFLRFACLFNKTIPFVFILIWQSAPLWIIVAVMVFILALVSIAFLVYFVRNSRFQSPFRGVAGV